MYLEATRKHGGECPRDSEGASAGHRRQAPRAADARESWTETAEALLGACSFESVAMGLLVIHPSSYKVHPQRSR
jgi:hypothetical protein